LHQATAFEFLSSVWPGLKEGDINKFNRTEVGKRVNFGLAYGSEGHALVKTGKWMDAKGQERNFTWNMLNKGMDRWKKRFVGVGQFIDLMPDVVRGYGGTATNVYGRERHFGPLLVHQSDYERGKAERECVNFFIQSVAASLTNRTIISIDRLLEKHGIGEDLICLVNTVHDSVAYEVKDHYVEWFQAALEAVALQPWPQLFNNQFRMDVADGQSWTEAELAA
jgi:DNA polymerase I-like protein with 3'-5' exonuclease and polymerase domains